MCTTFEPSYNITAWDTQHLKPSVPKCREHVAYQVTQIPSFGGLGRGFPPVRVGALLTHAFGSWVFGIPSYGGNEKVLLGSRHVYSHVCSIVRLTTNSRPNRILLRENVEYRTGHSELVDSEAHNIRYDVSPHNIADTILTCKTQQLERNVYVIRAK